MKTIVLSDLHIGIHRDGEIWLDQTTTLFQSIYDTCIKENISNVIIAGDLFHERKQLNVMTICKSMEIIASLDSIKLYIILGNHDTYYKNLTYPYSPFIFDNFENVHVISEPTVIDNISFLPWSTIPYNLEKYETPIVIGHFEIDGFPATSTDLFSGGLSMKDFAHFEMVISGHFHIPSKKENILYCGSPFHLTMSDRGSTCGYYILDDKELTFIENTDYAKYMRINTEEKVTPEQIKGNIVELSYIKDYGTLGNIRKMEYIQSMNPLRLSTNFTNISICDKKVNTGDINIVNKSNKEILKEYIDTIMMPKYIKKSTLNGVIDRLLKEINAS